MATRVRKYGGAAALLVPAVVFLLLAVPQMPWGPVIGTGQDEWYNVIRALRVLYDRLDPSYFIHPALYYEVLAAVYALEGAFLAIAGQLSGGTGFLDYFLAHQARFLDLARCVSVGAGALAVVAAAWLGTLLSGLGGGLLAGLVVASVPLLQTMGTSIRVDTLGLAAMLGGAALVVRRDQRRTTGSLLLAAAGIGVAASANYPGALLLAPLAWLEWMRRGDASLRQRAVAVVGAGGVALAVFLTLNPYVLIDLPNFLRWFAFQARVALETHPHGDSPSPSRYFELLREQGLPAVLACVAGVAAISGVRTPTGAFAAFGFVYLAAFSAMRSQYDRFALPAMALLGIAGAAWVCTQLARRWSARAAPRVALAAALAIMAAAAIDVRRELADSSDPGADYRADMFGWIAAHVPPSATLVFESDTLPLLQTVYDPGDGDDRLHIALRQAFERVNPRLPKRILKAQFIAAVYNYNRNLLDDGPLFFLASSQNRDYIAANRASLPEPASFYDALDARGRLVHETSGYHERLMLYAVGAE